MFQFGQGTLTTDEYNNSLKDIYIRTNCLYV